MYNKLEVVYHSENCMYMVWDGKFIKAWFTSQTDAITYCNLVNTGVVK